MGIRGILQSPERVVDGWRNHWHPRAQGVPMEVLGRREGVRAVRWHAGATARLGREWQGR